MVASGEEITGEFGKVMYTLLYSKWITNNGLLYSTWNSTQCYVPTWMKEVLGKDYKPILEAFISLAMLHCDETYESRTAKQYEVIVEVEEIECPEEIRPKVEEYRAKTKDILERARYGQQVQDLLRWLKLDDPEAGE